MRRALLLTAAAGIVLASCFSDRFSSTEPTDDTPECTVPGFAIGANHAVVFVRRFEFLPDTIRIKAGTTVTWVNCEAPHIEAHTSTSDDGLWDTSGFGPGETFTREFPTAGSFPYSCRPHPTMHGVVLVS